MSRAPLIEILTFQGCPNGPAAVDLVRRIVTETGVEATITVVDVPNAAVAAETRFLGSPTIRVDGHDVEPVTDRREDYGLACRVYRTATGLHGQPEERWVRDAILAAVG